MKFLFTTILIISPLFNTTYTDVKPIFKKRCALCHNQNGPQKDWLDKNTAEKYADKIRERVSNKTMPPVNITNITEEERKLIVEWTKAI